MADLCIKDAEIAELKGRIVELRNQLVLLQANLNVGIIDFLRM